MRTSKSQASRPQIASSTLRCGVVVHSLATGGLEEAVAMLALGLPAHGFQTSVLCTHSGGLVAERLRAAGIPVTVANGSPRAWRAWVKDTRPDVISTQFVSLNAMTLLARSAPVVEAVQNTNVWLSPSEWAEERGKCDIATSLVAVSDTVADYHRRMCGPYPMHVIPNGVDGNRVIGVPRTQARERLGFDTDDVVLVQVGRFCVQKNQIGIVEILAAVLEDDPRVKLVLVGGPGDAGYLERVVAQAGELLVRGAIRIVPYAPDPGLVLSAADAFISNSFFEGWSLAATEAAWLGRPVILSDCGGARELIGDDQHGGILIPNPGGDPATLAWAQVTNPATDVAARNRDALQRAVRSFVAKRNEWTDRSADIMRDTRARWSAERMTASYAAVLRAAAAAGARGSRQPPPPTPRGVLRHYWRVADVRQWHIVLPFLLVLLAGACEAASFSLLIPLTKAVGQNSFDFLTDSRTFGWIPHLVPRSLAGSPSRNLYLIVLTIGLIVAGRAGKLFFEYLRGFYVVARTERYRVAVGAETFARVLGFGRQYFDRRPIGAIDAEIGWSNSVIGLLTAAEEFVRYAVGLVVKAGVMLAISVPLSLAFVVTLPFVSWFVTTIDRRVERIAADGVEADRKVRSRILDILGSIPLVKVNSQERAVELSYVETLREAERVAIRRERVMSLRWPVEEVVILLVMLVVQGVVMALAKGFTPSDLAAFGAFLLIVQQALPDYKFMGMFRLRVAEERPRLEALARLFSDDDKFIVPSGARNFEGLTQNIEIHDLTFQYHPGDAVLKNISATIEAGKVTAIVGRTGAGKTTLVDLIARFYDCPPGTILLDGVDIREFALPTLHARMALVSQDVWLLNRTLRENLTFGLSRDVRNDELLAALDDVDLRAFFDGLREGLDTNLGDRGVRLSGGQRQRVALARALLRDPGILILDEATSALDSEVEQRVARAIQQRAAGRTLIVIAHRLSTIRDANNILVVDGGRVVEQGSWDQLLRCGGAFRRLYDAQFVGETH